MGDITITIAGNVAERRTEAEICWRADGNEQFVALVFETRDGWKTEIENTQLAASMGTAFETAIERARERLCDYVNRRGENLPDGLTAAGLSLWLMERADGTAMGRPIHD